MYIKQEEAEIPYNEKMDSDDSNYAVTNCPVVVRP
jgi:hypothetical protein